ncbi:MAG: hypothetical protein HYX69_17005 [Planctomycetia bacterium]|nr:hypothetical protein [Planctomycetia bacterium]
MKRLILVAIALCFASPATGGMRRPLVRGRSQRAEPRAQAIVADNRVTVAPFAVPVAVPVATVTQPTVFYRYGEYVPPAVAVPAFAETSAAGSGTSPTPSPDEHAAAGRPTVPAGAAVVTSDDAAIHILARHCAKCHSGPLAKGGKQFFDAEGRLFARLPRHVIVEMAEPNEAGRERMPPGELPKLSDDELKALRQWAKLPRDAVY